MKNSTTIQGTVIFNGEYMLEGMEATKTTELKPLTLEEVRSAAERINNMLPQPTSYNNSIPIKWLVLQLQTTAATLWEEKLEREARNGLSA